MHLTLDDVRNAVRSELEAGRSIAEDKHQEHHNFVEYLIEERRRKDELYDHLRKHLVGWGVIVGLTAMGALFYDWLVGFVRKASGN